MHSQCQRPVFVHEAADHVALLPHDLDRWADRLGSLGVEPLPPLVDSARRCRPHRRLAQPPELLIGDRHAQLGCEGAPVCSDQLAHHQTPLMMKRQLLGHTVVIAETIQHPEVPRVAGSSAALRLLWRGCCPDLLEPSADRERATAGNDHRVGGKWAVAFDAHAGDRRYSRPVGFSGQAQHLIAATDLHRCLGLGEAT